MSSIFINFCFLFFSHVLVYGQSTTTGWVNGYIVPNQGDTLRGQIFNRDTETASKSIRFRVTASEPHQDYAVLDLKAFYLQPSNERFIRQTVRMDRTPYTLGRVYKGTNLTWTIETILLKQLVNDSIALFYHRDNTGTDHYWVQLANRDLDELVLTTYYDANGKFRTQYRYRQQLFVLAQACPSLQNQAVNLPFQSSAIEQFVVSLNACYQHKPVPALRSSAVKPNQVKTEWGLQAGITQTTIRFVTEPSGYYGVEPLLVRLTSTPKFSGGLWANLYLPNKRQQWSIYGLLTYQAYSTTSQSQSITNEAAYVKLLTAFRWQQPGHVRWQPYVMLGITNGLALRLRNNYRFVGNRTYEQAVVGGIGLRHRRSFLEFRHERGNGTSSMIGHVTSTRTTGVYLGYTF